MWVLGIHINEKAYEWWLSKVKVQERHNKKKQAQIRMKDPCKFISWLHVTRMAGVSRGAERRGLARLLLVTSKDLPKKLMTS
jgi:hypothetical protein